MSDLSGINVKCNYINRLFFLIGIKLNVIKKNIAIRLCEAENDGKITGMTGKFAAFGIWNSGVLSRTFH